MADNEMPKIICRFRSGLRLDVAPDLPASLAKIVDHLEGGLRLEELITWDQKGMTEGGTWPHLVKEALRSFDAFPNGHEARRSPALRVLRAISVSGASPKEAWLAVRESLLEEIDLLTGWTHSPLRDGPHHATVWREGEAYYATIEGQKNQIFGLRTEEEERWDFIADDCTKSYGAVHGLIRVMALANICREYQRSRDNFPGHVSVVLPDGDHPAFLRWHWNVSWLYGLRRILWRPESVYCDPEWLIADLLSAFADSGHRAHVPDAGGLLQLDFNETSIEYESRFGRFRGQLEMALDTQLIFGRHEESWFEFEGLPLRWINQTSALNTVLIVPQVYGGSGDREYGLAMRFISKQAYETDSAITVIWFLVGARHYAPRLRQPKRTGISSYPDGFQLTLKRITDGSELEERKELALAFYREGLSSGSIYYGFLSFYKIVQLAFHDDKQKITTWIESTVRNLNSYGLREWLTQIENEHPDVTKYLFESGRCAIAHVGERGPVANPDNALDQRRIHRDLPIIKTLAHHAIDSGLFGGGTPPERKG